MLQKNHKKMTKLRNIIVLFIILGLSGCYPDSSIPPEESDTVYTSYNKDADFYNYKYYQISDSVLRIDDYGEVVMGQGRYDDLILRRVNQNLQSLGYINIAVNDTLKADVSIIVSDLSFLSISYYWNYIPYGYYYQWWDNYPTDENDVFYDAYYAISAPAGIFASAQSNIMIDMVESDFEPNQESVSIYWRGLTTGIYSAYMESRLLKNIDQMFYQSPYLKPKQ